MNGEEIIDKKKVNCTWHFFHWKDVYVKKMKSGDKVLISSSWTLSSSLWSSFPSIGFISFEMIYLFMMAY